jgi:hypothetical protein
MFHKQVVDTESNNANTLKIPYVPSDTHKCSAMSCPNIVTKAQVNHIAPINTDPRYSKALSSKIDYEGLSAYYAFRQNDVMQNIFRQTTQLAKSSIPSLYNII